MSSRKTLAHLQPTAAVLSRVQWTSHRKALQCEGLPIVSVGGLEPPTLCLKDSHPPVGRSRNTRAVYANLLRSPMKFVSMQVFPALAAYRCIMSTCDTTSGASSLGVSPLTTTNHSALLESCIPSESERNVSSSKWYPLSSPLSPQYEQGYPVIQIVAPFGISSAIFCTKAA